jgi:hypothetical protein
VACCIVLPLLAGAAGRQGTRVNARTSARVHVRTLTNGHFQLMVDNKPFVVKGVCYSPIPIGKNQQYDWWSDPAKPWLVDGKLMKEMGINAVRIYQPGDNVEAVRTVIRDLYERYGIYTILGHWLGFWEYPYPFYGDKEFQARVKHEVLSMVQAYKDEPGVLLWILGNENNYSFGGRVNPWSTDEIDRETDPQKQMTARARIYYSFVNSITEDIHGLDPDHPVALGNGELIALDIARESAPSVDIVACIIYRGKTFGNLFNSLRHTFDKPVLLSEFGADGYDAFQDKEDQNMQAFFLESQWRQIYSNLANVKDGSGNCLGGAMFEWNDEWWKHNDQDPEGWSVHDTASNWSNGSYYFDIKAPNNKNMNEEWFGIVALSEDLDQGINRRVLKKAYYVIREFWKKPVLKVKSSKGKGKP